MSQNLESILAELQADDELRREILEAEQQIRRGDVVPWSEVKRRHEL